MTDVTIYAAPLPEGPEASHRLLRRAAALAAPQLTDCTLARQAQGKPWFPAAPELHFSISHSGGRWVCAFADAPVGLDLQAHRPCRRVALARRFFAPEEAEWLRLRGEAAFFDPGARRRAGSNTPAAAFPPCRRRSSLRRTASFPPARTRGCSCCRSSTGIRCACVRRMPRGSRCGNCKATPHNCVFALRRIFSVNPAV